MKLTVTRIFVVLSGIWHPVGLCARILDGK